MLPLDKSLRNKLEKTVKDAREFAEAGAKAALEQMGVGNSQPYPFLSDAEKELRRKLRVHGRQLGDTRNEEYGTQSIELLTDEIAYEHWHRMLFARFLAENNLLMDDDPDTPVAISLEECEELALEKGVTNGWELASRYAARMLPQIFRPDSPVFQITFPPNQQQNLEKLLNGLPPDTFHASDALGWVYQYWQAKKKEDVNKSAVKIGARELPAVTQLFTEPYMVSFLLDNSLGAWWAAKVLNDDDLKSAETEEELREKAAILGVPLKYLRFIKSDDNRWKPAGGWYEKWNQEISKLRILDPCCGSGHFLVSTLLMLVPMYMKLEGISAKEAIERVLKENIYGLEIDKRCVEIAVFALALVAWTYPPFGSYSKLPQMNIACCGLSVGVAKEEWEKLANGNTLMRKALGWLHDFYKDAPVLGSLLNPKADKDGAHLRINFPEFSFDKLLDKVRPDEEKEAGLAAKGLLDATQILLNSYDLIITNVPYLARGKQEKKLLEHCENYFPAAKNDLATVFLDRCLQLCKKGGNASIVLPQNWLFLTSYKKFREKLLINDAWHLIARLGPGAFETISGEVVKAILLSISRSQDDQSFPLGYNDNQSNTITGIDVSEIRSAHDKDTNLITTEVNTVNQKQQLSNPDARVLLSMSMINRLLGDYSEVPQGIKSGDDNRFRFMNWELSKMYGWKLYQSTPSTEELTYYSGLEYIIRWDNDGSNLARRQGEYAWGKRGIAISQMSLMPWSLYTGVIQDSNINVVIPICMAQLLPIGCYTTSPEFKTNVRILDQKLSVTNSTIKKVPFDLDYWTKVAEEKYPNGLPKPYSDDPTQWIFHGHPCGSIMWNEETKKLERGRLRTDNTVLQIAVARLLGYQWPTETDTQMELSDESRQWVQKSSELLSLADEDGIVSIPSVRGEESAADRIIRLLAASYGDEWSNGILDELLRNADHAGKSLESWLRDKFFAQHCKLFHHRPFIWHIWDGLSDGFSVLVNYHKFDFKALQTLIYTYLGDWIAKQKHDIESGIEGTLEKLAAAETLKKKLELILLGEEPYDIFVRWKTLEKQAIGWNPDLNDGVRMNIRPFVTAEVLRFYKKPILNINWEKDRGKDVSTAPWYHLDKGDRINDRHIKLEQKKNARGNHAEE